MQKRQNKFSTKNYIPFYLFFLILLKPVFLYPQSTNNLDVFDNLVDSASVQIRNSIPAASKNIYLQLNLGQSYSVFGNRLIADLQSGGINVSTIRDTSLNSPPILSFVIDNARVKYGEMFRKAFFGSFYVQRDISIKGNFAIITNKSVVQKFSFNSLDTVRVSDVRDLENESFPFTQGKLPTEPFFSSFYEPVIAIGTAAVAIYLFFKVRSK